MSKESQYLQEVSEKLKTCSRLAAELDSNDAEVASKSIAYLEEAIAFEKEAREKYEIGSRFSVIANQLKELYQKCMQQLNAGAASVEEEKLQHSHKKISDDEMLVFVYMFNSQGQQLASWTKLLSPQALIDHSINRPVYANQDHIESLLRSKTHQELHGYIEVAIKKSDILMSADNSVLKDSVGNPLMRLKQGALKLNRICHFNHKGQMYKLSPEGKLVLQS